MHTTPKIAKNYKIKMIYYNAWKYNNKKIRRAKNYKSNYWTKVKLEMTTVGKRTWRVGLRWERTVTYTRHATLTWWLLGDQGS